MNFIAPAIFDFWDNAKIPPRVGRPSLGLCFSDVATLVQFLVLEEWSVVTALLNTHISVFGTSSSKAALLNLFSLRLKMVTMVTQKI